MQIITDLLPVILFFIAYKKAGIFAATAVAMISTLLLIGVIWLKRGKIDKMLAINGAVITVLGGITLLLHDKTYIMWKPTAIYWIGALALLFSRYAFKRNLIERMLGKMMSPPAVTWDKLNLYWIAFLIGMGILNLYVAFHYSEDDWVNFKLFGATSLMFIFMIVQVFALRAHWVEQNQPPA
ncbi:septation protein A [Methylophilus sp. DW102]|uniref:septation protein A n=1 Tax=Methylophilus sp. DW102 TaxID=3095607 RepID=UPI0030920587|nr:septation protein A [Methylophilus sp. DW102]